MVASAEPIGCWAEEMEAEEEARCRVTVQLDSQGCKRSPVVAQLPPPSPTVMTQYKPPKRSQAVSAEDRDTGNTSSQEMEEYAMEIMDQMDM